MPIFEYQCEACGKTTEKLVLDGTEEIVCEHCGSSDVHKVLSKSSTFGERRVSEMRPGPGAASCCGSNPASRGCVPGSCCGK